MNAVAFRTCLGLLLFLTSCGIGEIKQRQAALESLCTTNASLATVQSALGVHFTIRNRGSSDWNEMQKKYGHLNSPRYRRLIQKMGRASAVGLTSTESMLTWIFLDEHTRLIDFEVDAQ